jgi:hypothetical protein
LRQLTSTWNAATMAAPQAAMISPSGASFGFGRVALRYRGSLGGANQPIGQQQSITSDG